MRQGLRTAIPALAVTLLVSGVVLAQRAILPEQPSQPAEYQPRIRLDVTRVNVLFTVSDKRGRFVTDLTKDDFEVFDRKRRQTILEFTALNDLPLRLAILLDTSNSVRPRFRFQQEAAIEFLNSVMRPEIDKAVLVSFDSGVRAVTPLTNDVEELASAIRDLRPGGGTALYEAIYHACKNILMADQPLHKFRRAIVVISDGEDNISTVTRDQALEMAHRADAIIYAISSNATGLETRGDRVLKYFAEETGGIAFFPFKVEDLTQSFANIANELRHQYSLMFRPDPLETDGLYHPISIQVKGRKDLIVRARKGYYAPLL